MFIKRMSQADTDREPNPFTSKKVLNKFEQQSFNFAVKLVVDGSEPSIPKGEAYKQVSSRWNDEVYRKTQTCAYINERIYKVAGQLEQLDHYLI
jgi:hypothetical protein